MQIQINPAYPYPVLFLISSRAAAAGYPPGEVIGVLIVKQTIGANGVTPLPKNQQSPIELKDVTYVPYPPDDSSKLAIKLESDLASFKPFMDVVAVRNQPQKGFFGGVRFDRGTGFVPNPANRLNYGWLNRPESPRKDLAGAAGSFVPNVNDKFKLPAGFKNKFFNGSPLRDSQNLNHVEPGHMQAGDRVEFGDASHRVTIPAGPNLEFQMDENAIEPAVMVDRHVDTVVYHESQNVYLLTWRSIFAWEARLENAVLFVS